MATIFLQSRDGLIFITETEPMLCSALIRRRLQAMAPENVGHTVFPLVKVDSNILSKLINWTKHHYDNNLFEVDLPLSEVEMLQNEPLNTLHKLAMAAMYMGIPKLAQLTITRISCILHYKTLEEMDAIEAEFINSDGERLEPA